VVESLYAGYGEGSPQGNGPDQAQIQVAGNANLMENFAHFDYVRAATIVA